MHDERVVGDPPPEYVDTKWGSYLSASYVKRVSSVARSEAFREIYAHCERVGLNIVIDQQALKAIEFGQCPKPGSHE